MILVVNVKRIIHRIIIKWKSALCLSIIIAIAFATLSGLKLSTTPAPEETHIMKARLMFIFEDEVLFNKDTMIYEVVKNNSMVYICSNNTMQQVAETANDPKIDLKFIQSNTSIDFAAGSDIFDITICGETSEQVEKSLRAYVDVVTSSSLNPPMVDNIDLLYFPPAATNLTMNSKESAAGASRFKIIKYAIIGFLAGMMAHAAWCVIGSMFDRKIRDADSVLEQFELPLLQELTGNISKEFDARQIANLKNTLLLLCERQVASSIVVLEAKTGETVSKLVSWNIANSIAQTGKSILWVDMSFLKDSKALGISDSLTDANIVFKSLIAQEENIDALYSGTKLEQAISVMTPLKLESLCEQITTQYDFVVYSVGLCPVSSETLMLLSQDNINIMVLEQNASDIVEVNRAISLISGLKSKTVGLVLKLNNKNEKKKLGGRI
ncbi:hypothetical protein V6615_08465 [Oscillospiraceae bacterium PP1C4]